MGHIAVLKKAQADIHVQSTLKPDRDMPVIFLCVNVLVKWVNIAKVAII